MTRLGIDRPPPSPAPGWPNGAADPLTNVRDRARALAATRDRLRSQTFTAGDLGRFVEVTVDGVGAPTHIRVTARGRALGPVRLGVPVVAALAACRQQFDASTADLLADELDIRPDQTTLGPLHPPASDEDDEAETIIGRGVDRSGTCAAVLRRPGTVAALQLHPSAPVHDPVRLAAVVADAVLAARIDVRTRVATATSDPKVVRLRSR